MTRESPWLTEEVLEAGVGVDIASLIVVSHSKEGEVLRPFSCVRKAPHHCLQIPVHSFDCPIRLRVIGRGMVDFSAMIRAKFMESC